MTLDTATLEQVNLELGHKPEALVAWAIGLGEPIIATTSFGPFAGVILHMATQVWPKIPVVWMDSGYATPETYRYADALQRQLDLNLTIYQPRRSRAHREAVDGPLPAVGAPGHDAFTAEVKLEPFDRAIAEFKPKLWITGVRAEETAERARMQPLAFNARGIVKVAPLLGWSSKQLHEYLKRHDLPNNFDYFDPTKGDDNRECGLHIAN